MRLLFMNVGSEFKFMIFKRKTFTLSMDMKFLVPLRIALKVISAIFLRRSCREREPANAQPSNKTPQEG